MCVCLREHWQHNKLWIIAKTSRKSEWFTSEWRPCAGEGGREGWRGGGMFLYGAGCIKLRGKLSLQPRVWVWALAWGGFQEDPLGLHQPLRPTDQLWRANSPQLCLFLSLLIHHTVWWLASVLCTRLPLFPFIKHTHPAFAEAGGFNNEYAKCFSSMIAGGINSASDI